jgi:hypothetical protein
MSYPKYESIIEHNTVFHENTDNKIWRTFPSPNPPEMNYEDHAHLYEFMIALVKEFQKLVKNIKMGILEWKVKYAFNDRNLILEFLWEPYVLGASILDGETRYIVEFFVDKTPAF